MKKIQSRMFWVVGLGLLFSSTLIAGVQHEVVEVSSNYRLACQYSFGPGDDGRNVSAVTIPPERPERECRACGNDCHGCKRREGNNIVATCFELPKSAEVSKTNPPQRIFQKEADQGIKLPIVVSTVCTGLKRTNNPLSECLNLQRKALEGPTQAVNRVRYPKSGKKRRGAGSAR